MGLADRFLPYYTVEERNNWQGDWELIEGIPYALASPSVERQRILAKLIVEINKSLENCNCEVLPDTDYYISEDTVVRPDILVICKEVKEKIIITPEIIFEIVSPSSVKMDEHLKFELYEREKVKYYVLVYPSKRKHIKIFKLVGNQYQKVFETIEEKFNFELNNCLITLDFSKIWN
jgi:Uma2 family endonuclease